MWALKPYVSADLSRHPALICERSVISSEPRNITLGLFTLVLNDWLSPSCSPIFDSYSNCHNYVLPCLPSVNDCMFNQVEIFFFFLVPLPFFLPSVTSPRKRAIKSHVDVIFPRYWIRTNTDVSLIRFRQMSCFMPHCLPSVTWNNLILPPRIMPLRWLIFTDAKALLFVAVPSSQSEAETPSDSSAPQKKKKKIKLSVSCVQLLSLKHIYLCEIIIYFPSSLTHSSSAMDLRCSQLEKDF